MEAVVVAEEEVDTLVVEAVPEVEGDAQVVVAAALVKVLGEAGDVVMAEVVATIKTVEAPLDPDSVPLAGILSDCPHSRRTFTGRAPQSPNELEGRWTLIWTSTRSR